MVTEVGPAAFGPAVNAAVEMGEGPAAGAGHRESSNQAGASVDLGSQQCLQKPFL